VALTRLSDDVTHDIGIGTGYWYHHRPLVLGTGYWVCFVVSF